MGEFSDISLHSETVGSGPPLVLLHGFLGSSDNWRSMSRRLASHYRVFALDLRNHGRSPHSEIFDYDVMAADVREFVAQRRLPRILLLGHSMGGKVAMQYAVEYSATVDKLVVVEIAPKPYEPAQRDLLSALRGLDLSRYKSFSEVDAALASKIPDGSVRRFLLKNLARSDMGRLSWRIHLEALDRNYSRLGRGIAPDRRFHKPTLFIRGGRSNYIEATDGPAIREIFPQAVIATIAEAGHWVHTDCPSEFFDKLMNFLNGA
jgi:pimeloyl-ACP methyl ester carboxylesterase